MWGWLEDVCEAVYEVVSLIFVILFGVLGSLVLIGLLIITVASIFA